MKTKILSVLAIVILLFASCKKAEQGPQGPAGSPGTNGNANLINLSYTISPQQWQTGCNNYCLSASITETALTQAIVDNAQINVYRYQNTALNGTGDEWLILPTTVADQELSFSFSKNTINFKIFITCSSCGLQPIKPTNNTIFKMVIVPKP